MRRTIPILVILIGLLALWGCSKKNPTQATNKSQEQAFATESQTNAVRAFDFVGSFPAGLDSFEPGQPGSFNTPYPPDTLKWKGPIQNPHQPSPPNTWYRAHWDTTFQQSNTSVHDTVFVRFTPDIWGGGLPPVTQVDWEALVNVIVGGTSGTTTQTSLDDSASVRYSAGGSDKTDGGIRITGSVKANNSVISNFIYRFTWLNCTRTGWRKTDIPHTCSGNIGWTATSSYAFQTYTLSGSYSFSNGSCSEAPVMFNNTVFAKFWFTPDGNGYYTLLSEGWQTKHDFKW